MRASLCGWNGGASFQVAAGPDLLPTPDAVAVAPADPPPCTQPAGDRSARTRSIRWVGVNLQGHGHAVVFTTRSGELRVRSTGSGMCVWPDPNSCGRTPGRKSQTSARASGRRTRPISAQKRRPALAGSWTVGGGLGAGDHGRVQVEAGHLQPVLADQPERQLAGSAPNLQHPSAGGGDRGDVAGDALEERAEQKPAEGVVEDGIADEDASRHLVSSGGPVAVSPDGDGPAAAPARSSNLRGRTITPPLGIPEL
jgi:hypothetical protein